MNKLHKDAAIYSELVSIIERDSDAVYDIFILDIATLQEKNLSNSINMDFAPIWHPDGQKISFTSIFDESINLFTYDFNFF